MPADRDVAAFDQRAGTYESGWRGRMHTGIADRVVALALATAPDPGRVVDVGSGTGYALRELARRLPGATALTGVDPAPGMVRTAQAAADDGRLRFVPGTAEHLPLDDASADLVVSTTSFDHWADQRAGLAEIARVLAPGGHLVLTDLFSAWLLPTLIGDRRSKARTRGRVTRLITEVGLREPRWHPLYTPVIQTVTATK